ncbi:MFS transporter [Gephyromycinifex aptenodytis]|uniref:MFS transporter n=1 Tax=Gephyromycinifex aptenodytis TaxID=2716227 RepID=UPI001D023914|nr:MFS transporter [Gephyromycinifex aptenodytis]
MSSPRTEAQRRTVIVLTIAQVFSSLGNGSSIALGSVLAVQFSGRESLAGAANTALGLGAAFSAIPLARLAMARGRRIGLGAGLLAAILGTMMMVAAVLTNSFAVLVIGCALVGVATAVNLQARFAVTDLADPAHRGRDLSIVVWAITIGAVLGPNTVGPGAYLAAPLNLPPYAGAFLISAAGMVIGGTVILVGLRPDPLLLRRELDGEQRKPARQASWRAGASIVAAHPVSLAAVLAMLGAHTTMVAVMSMTPLHLAHHAHGGSDADTLTLIGLTISLHIAGMYALSPLMGAFTDRLGPRVVALGGLAVVALAAVMTGFGSAHVPLVTAGLVVLGLGWSATTVAGATLLTTSLPPTERVQAQGFTDALTSLCGALGSASAGLVMGRLDYPGVSAVYGTLAVGAAVGVFLITSSARARQHASSLRH